MDVILHVGAHRTATSALQSHLHANRDALAEAGVGYWGPKITRGGLFHGAIGGSLPVLPWQERRFVSRCAMRAEGARLRGVSKLIISDENLLGSLRGTLEDTRLYGDARARIAAYAKGFANHRITIAMCTRDYAPWWTSALAFSLMRAGPLPRTAMREHLVTQPRRWRHIVEEIAHALPDATVMVWTYEGLAHAPERIVQEWTGLETPAPNAPRHNPRPTSAAIRDFMASCDIDTKRFERHDGTFAPFAPHEQEALSAQYSDDLAWLANGAGGLADYIDTPAAVGDRDERGHADDGQNRHLA